MFLLVPAHPGFPGQIPQSRKTVVCVCVCVCVSGKLILDLCNGIAKEGCTAQDWKSSTVLLVYKQKGDPMECGSYKGIKLLEHATKVVEKIFEDRIQQQIDIDDTQLGFINAKELLMPFLV